MYNEQVDRNKNRIYFTQNNTTLQSANKDHSMSQKYLKTAAGSKGKLPNARSFASTGKKIRETSLTQSIKKSSPKFSLKMKSGPKNVRHKKQAFKYVAKTSSQMNSLEMFKSPQEPKSKKVSKKMKSSQKLFSYSKYLASSRNKPKKLGYSQSTLTLQNPCFAEDSRATESQKSSITTSTNPGIKANKIHVFPNKRMMPDKDGDSSTPQPKAGMISFIKNRLSGEGMKRYSASNETDQKCQNSARSQGKLTTEASSTKKNSGRIIGKRNEDIEKELRARYLKELIDPDKHSIPIDKKFKGFSFVQRRILSSHKKEKVQSKTKAACTSPADMSKKKAAKEAKIRKM